MSKLGENHAQAQGHNKGAGKHGLQTLIIGLGMAALLIGAGPAPAQTGEPRAKAAAGETRITFKIPAQPLESAVTAFGFQAGYQIAVDQATLTGLNGNEVRGNFTPAEALGRLLATTGVTYRLIDENSATLVAAGPDAAEEEPIAMPPLTVEGETWVFEESAYESFEGYIPKHSSTATKTDTPIIETPQSISVVSRRDMDIRNVRDVGEAVAYTAGVTAGIGGENALFNGNGTIIRGFGQTAYLTNAYLDGTKLEHFGYIGVNMDPWLFERVEVLKGPASVLFGQTEPGGIINRVSKRPYIGMLNQIRLGTGNFDKAHLAFDLGAELSDAWQFRAVGLALDGEARQVHSERERQLIAPSLRWTNGDSDLTLLMHYQRDNMSASWYNHLPRAAVFGNPNGRIPLNFRVGDPTWGLWDHEVWSVGYLFRHDFNDALSFRQNLRYINQNLNARRTWHNRPLKDQRILNRLAIQDRDDSYSWTIDNQLQWKLTTGTINHTLLTGIDYFKGSGNQYLVFDAAPPLDLFAPVYNQIFPPPTRLSRDDKLDIQRTGIYMQDQIKIGDLSLLIGGRYDKAQSSFESKTRPGTDSRRSDQAFTGRAGAIYNFANGFAPYVSYAESFDPVIYGNAFDGSPFEPTEGKQYEAGIKYQPTGAEHLITMAAFDLTQENVLTADPVNPGFRIQTGEVQVRGIELEGKFSVNDNLYVTGAYTYLDHEVTKSNDGDKGKRRTQVLRHNASLWANYSLNRGMLAGMGLGVGVRYFGKTEGDWLNTFSVPGYTLVDLAAHYDLGQSPFRLEGWRASLNVNNLFDKYYIPSCLSELVCYLGLERSVRFSIGYEWDW